MISGDFFTACRPAANISSHNRTYPSVYRPGYFYLFAFFSDSTDISSI